MIILNIKNIEEQDFKPKRFFTNKGKMYEIKTDIEGRDYITIKEKNFFI